MIDPFFYGAYALDGPDLLQRFGTGNYYWPRVGFILPDTLFVRLLGPVAGFFAFRYVLALVAIVPVYLLFRQVLGRGAAWIAVLTVLTAPVVLSAWGSDYPDSSAVSYLMGGTCLLFLRPSTPRRRWLLLLAAGCLFGLAVNSQVVAVFTVVGAVVGRWVATWTNGRAALMRDGAAIVAGAVAITAVLVLFSATTLGQWDIFRPTVHALIQYRVPQVEALFHSSTWRWLLDDIYVLAPPALLLTWLAGTWLPRRSFAASGAELGFAVAAGVAYGFHAFFQLVGNNWTLEYYLYTSMLWATVSPLLVFTAMRLVRRSQSLRPTGRELVVVAVSLLGIPLVLRVFRDELQLGLAAAVLLVVVSVVGAVVARVGRPLLALRVCGVAVTVAALTLLVVGLPKNPTIYPGQVAYYTPDYGTALFGDGAAEVDRYAIFADLHTVVPTWSEVPGGLVTWAPPAHSDVLNVASAQYLWLSEALPAQMPSLDQSTIASLSARHPRVVVMLSDTGSEFQAAQQALSIGGYAPQLIRQATLRSGGDVLWVRVLELMHQASH